MVNTINLNEIEKRCWILKGKLTNAGMNQRDLAKKLGVSPAFVSLVLHGKKKSLKVEKALMDLVPLTGAYPITYGE